jgi:5-methylcytosine-specific restriction endonuclease McrA
MVIRLQLPDIDYDTFIDAVVAERQAGGNAEYFTDLQDEWKTRTQEYLDNKGNPEVIKRWNRVAKADGKKFVNLYSSPGEESVHRPILKGLRARTLQICPACGEDGTPNTLDHYLPKDDFPEFAITAANLSPMCDICQSEKKTKTITAANERIFLHPYYDEFLGTQVVVLEFEKPLETPPSIRLRPSPALDTAQTALVSRHIHELGVIRRYNHFFRDEYMRLLRLTSDIHQRGQNLREQLENFRNMASYKSVNSWLHVFYSGVTADNDLMAYLETGDIPDFV